MNPQDDVAAALAPVTAAFHKLGVRHYVGGSVASSFHGAARSTMDVDLIAELTEVEVTEFLNCFQGDFYVSEVAVRDAIRRKSCFSLIHFATSFKDDVFISQGRPFDISAMQRATIEQLGDGQVVEIAVATAEDAIISKLEWYRKTNETSGRQWDDVTRLLKLLRDNADFGYLEKSAQSVGVSDLYERLLSEVYPRIGTDQGPKG